MQQTFQVFSTKNEFYVVLCYHITRNRGPVVIYLVYMFFDPLYLSNVDRGRLKSPLLIAFCDVLLSFTVIFAVYLTFLLLVQYIYFLYLHHK